MRGAPVSSRPPSRPIHSGSCSSLMRGGAGGSSSPPSNPPARSSVLQVAQLHHELNLKDELLQFYTSVAEESEGESTTSTP